MDFGELHKQGGDFLFYENYVAYCKKIGKSKSAVAKEIGLDPKSVTGWKNGAAPRNETQKKLADYFGISADELMGTKKEPAGKGGLDEQMQMIVDLLNGATQEERDAVETLLKSKVKKD